MAKISVIIPVYNVEQYLRECLDSLINQTLEDIEIICVDDSSKDSSLDILKEYASKDSRVKYDSFPQSRSALNARIRAVEMSTGKYIMFLDSDDYLELDACEILYNKIEEEKVDILHFSSQVVNCANIPQSRIDLNARIILPYEKRVEGKAVFENCFINKKFAITLWNKIFNADVVKKAFRDLEREYLPKAQDLYAFFVIAYYADSYLGWNSKPLHYYCFGRGVTGANILTLDKYRRYCTQVNIVKCLKNFYNLRIQNDGSVLKVIEDYYQQWLDECIRLFENNLQSEDQPGGFEVLCEYWGSRTVVEKLSRKHWYKRSWLAKKIGRLSVTPLKDKEVKTIAIYYYHFTIGGVQRVISLLIPMLKNMGYNVLLITDKEATEEDFSLPDGVERVYIHDYRKSLANDYSKRLDSWEKILSEYSIDVVLYNAWTSNMLLWDMMYLKSCNINVVVQTHSVFTYSVLKLNKEFSEFPPVMALADAMIVLSEADRAFWSVFNKNVYCIPNPIADGLASGEKSDWSNKALIWVGRVSDEKQPYAVFSIMEKVAKVHPDVCLYLVGDFSDEKWKAIAAKKGIKNNIIFCGRTTEVEKYYRKASINLITSKYEGFSMVLVESKSYGIPTVMFSMPYLKLAKENTGVAGVDNLDYTAAANMIIRLLEDKNLWELYSRQAVEDFNNLYAYDYISAWKKVLTGYEQESVIGDDVRSMIHTIVAHYDEGIKYQGRLKNNSNSANNEKTFLGRVATIISNLPVLLRRGVQCYKDNGMTYTINNIANKIKNLFFPQR